MARPTHGSCEAIGVFEIERGHFGPTRLDGVRFAQLFRWPGAVHEGDGHQRLIVDERTTPEQRRALVELVSGTQGHPFFEIFAAVTPHKQAPAVAPIEFERDREGRRARVRIPDLAEARVEPIKNPVTGEEHRGRIDLPGGFEYRQAEVANAAGWRVTSGETLTMEHADTHCHIAGFEWSSDGTTR
jgi:hypothetical protein